MIGQTDVHRKPKGKIQSILDLILIGYTATATATATATIRAVVK
jgi:hypothetical protein